MHRNFLLPFLVACIGLFAPRIASAADVAVFPPEMGNLSAQDASTVGELIAQAYASVSQQSVVSPTYAQTALTQGQTYEGAAAQLGVKEYIRLSAVAAGRYIAIAASRYQADGRLLQQAKQNANGIEGLTYTADSMARALLGQSAPAPVLAPTVTQPMEYAPQVRQPRKKREDHMDYGVKAGVHLPFAKNSRYYSAVSLQFDGRLQFPRFFLEFGVGFILPTVIDDNSYDSNCGYDGNGNYTCMDAPRSNRGYIGGITTELGASYYLTDTNIAPYIGGGLIPRVVLAGLDGGEDKRDIASMSAYAQVGFTLPRRSTTHFFCDLRLAQAILPQHLDNDREVWPTEPSLHVGLGW